MKERKSIGLIKVKTSSGWNIDEIDNLGNNHLVKSTDMDCTITNGAGQAIIVYENGIKEMYDFSRGYRSGNLKQI